MSSMVRKARIGQGGCMQFPGPVRAVVGLFANAAEEAKHLPDRAVELPMLAVSTALQMSLRAQQRYAQLAARGDEVLSRRPATDDPPPWATFDAPVSIDELRHGAPPNDQAVAASDLLDELLGADGAGGAGTDEPGPLAASTTAPAKKAPARKVPVRKAPAAEKAAPAKKAVAAAKKAPAKKPAKRAADAGRGKSVNGPRHTAPSRFDAVGDDPADA